MYLNLEEGKTMGRSAILPVAELLIFPRPLVSFFQKCKKRKTVMKVGNPTFKLREFVSGSLSTCSTVAVKRETTIMMALA